MRRHLLLVLLVACVLLLTGCAVKMEMGLVVGKDGKVTMSVISAMDNEFIDASLSMSESSSNSEEESSEQTKTYTDEERWAYMEKSAEDDEEEYKDYRKEKYEEGEFKGYKYTRDLGKLEDVTEEATSESISYEELTQKDKFFVKKNGVYTLHLDMNKESGDLSQAEDYSEQGIDMIINFSITLPEKAKSHNATSVSKDGLTYTWNLMEAQSIDISFNDFDRKGGSFLPFLFICAIVVVVIVVISKKKQQNMVNDYANDSGSTNDIDNNNPVE